MAAIENRRGWKSQKAFLQGIFVLVFLNALFCIQPSIPTEARSGVAAPLADAPPTVTLNVPSQVLLGADVPFSITFDNADPDAGYGPFIDVILDTNGADGVYPGTPAANAYDGLGTPPASITASYLGTPIASLRISSSCLLVLLDKPHIHWRGMPQETI